MKRLFSLFAIVILAGCLGMPEGITPIKGFDLTRYTGQWYEIARLDHPFERGLERVTADYSLKEDGGITVINRGYSSEDNEWKQIEGNAHFVNNETEGYLKVSFFGPFYGSYIIFELDRKNYQYAFVSGPNNSYLWLLSRKPTLPEEIVDRFIEESKSLGFAVDELVFVGHPDDAK